MDIIKKFKIWFFNKQIRKSPEDHFKVTITTEHIKAEHPQRNTEQIDWKNIELIKLINTDSGPWLPDVWLALFGEKDGCLIPLGAKGYDEIYDIVSKYDGFNFENVNLSMTCTENREFVLWTKRND